MSDSTAEQREQVIVCKWNRELIATMLEHASEVYVILDGFDIEHMSPDWELLEGAAKVYRIGEFDSLEEIASVAADLSLRGVSGDRIVSFTEFSQYGAGYLSTLLGNSDDPLRHVSYRDKRLMKRRVAAAGVPTARWASLPDRADRGDLAAVAERLEFPLVVKPVAGAGTIGTITVRSAEELEPSLESLGPLPYFKSRQLIAEEFVTGRELHVDALWNGDEPLFLVVSAYFVNVLSVLEGLKESTADTGTPLDGSYVISPEDAPDLYKRVLDLHRDVNRAFGIDRAVTHLELFERPDGELVFSEIATRLGGAYVGSMLTEVLGQDIFEVVGEGLVRGALPKSRGEHRYVGAVHLRPAAPGRITSLPSEEEMLAVDGVLQAQRLAQVGSVVDFSHPSEWCVFVILGADTAEEFDALVARVSRELVVGVEAVESEGSPHP
ncbi:ATP-grasp domain-containing protein [Streptomyces sp. NPDC056528]|uniref:ATP-grasp domain-containing protein n=1 Tax=Streptomyces sp. NPDC056528 TaxID=3345854 RepID=UPI0036CAD753